MCMGSLDEAEGLKPGSHIFASQNVGWYDINDGVKCYEMFPEGFQEKIDDWRMRQGNAS